MKLALKNTYYLSKRADSGLSQLFFACRRTLLVRLRAIKQIDTHQPAALLPLKNRHSLRPDQSGFITLLLLLLVILIAAIAFAFIRVKNAQG